MNHRFWSYSVTERHWAQLRQAWQNMDRSSPEAVYRQWGRQRSGLIRAAGIALDDRRHCLTAPVRKQLYQLARLAGVEAAIQALYRGEPVNHTEGVPALHMAVRADRDEGWCWQGESIWAQVQASREKTDQIAHAICHGLWRGATGKRIETVVQMGIGGSDFGPRLVCDAFDFMRTGPEVHFLANLDRSRSRHLLDQLNPETTLFIATSKSFRTEETLFNLRLAQRWLQAAMGERPEVIRRHCLAVTGRYDRAVEMGIPEANCLPIWDWLGGRYSVWSGVGLPIRIALGSRLFGDFLAGARAMDAHFVQAPLEENLPVWLALLGIWYRNGAGWPGQVMAAYEDRLSIMITYLQQLDMESLGKSVRRDGQPVDVPTGPVIWGGIGTSVQHTFFQAIHQGCQPMLVDFIFALRHPDDSSETRKRMLANVLAQAAALFWGQGEEEAKDVYQQMPGLRPSNLLLMDDFSPHHLGALLALHEHRAFVQSVIWDINAFDQWGVEKGKRIASQLLPVLQGEPAGLQALDPLTRQSLEDLLNQ